MFVLKYDIFKIIKVILAHTIDGENTVFAMIQSPEKVTTGKIYYVLDEISNISMSL